MMLVKYEAFYLPSKTNLMDFYWKGILTKYGETTAEIEVKNEDDATIKLGNILNEIKKELPKEYLSINGSLRKCNCAVVHAEKPQIKLTFDVEVDNLIKNFTPKLLKDFNEKEKIKIFQRLYCHALEVWRLKARNEKPDVEIQDAFDALMESMLANEDQQNLFWDAYNALPGDELKKLILKMG